MSVRLHGALGRVAVVWVAGSISAGVAHFRTLTVVTRKVES